MLRHSCPNREHSRLVVPPMAAWLRSLQKRTMYQGDVVGVSNGGVGHHRAYCEVPPTAVKTVVAECNMTAGVAVASHDGVGCAHYTVGWLRGINAPGIVADGRPCPALPVALVCQPGPAS